MSGNEIPEVVRTLIATSIDSISELEAILLLRDHRNRAWTREEAGRRLYVSQLVAGYILEVLSNRGLFVQEGEGYRYAPRTPDIEHAADALAETYARNLIGVTHLVHAKPGPGVLEFARAFRFRKEN
jgi:hypothetical protein